MSTTATAPDAPFVASVVKRRSPSLSEYVSAHVGKRVVGLTSQQAFIRTIEKAGVRTRLLPGETHPKFNLEDLQRVARESVHVGLPKEQASA